MRDGAESRMALITPHLGLGAQGHVPPSGGGVDGAPPAVCEAKIAAAGDDARWIFTSL